MDALARRAGKDRKRRTDRASRGHRALDRPALRRQQGRIGEKTHQQRDDFPLAIDVELRIEALLVVLYRADAESQLLRDAPSVAPLQRQLEEFAFARAQPIPARDGVEYGPEIGVDGIRAAALDEEDVAVRPYRTVVAQAVAMQDGLADLDDFSIEVRLRIAGDVPPRY